MAQHFSNRNKFNLLSTMVLWQCFPSLIPACVLVTGIYMAMVNIGA